MDEDGNIVAAYRLGPKQELPVVASALLQVNNTIYDLSSTQTLSDIDQQLIDRYTAPTENWQPQNYELDTESDSVVETIRAVNNAVIDEVEDDFANAQLDLSARNQGLKYTDKLIGELRSLGIPARAVLGKVSTDGNQLLSKPTSHAWAEAYAPGIGWMTIDPVISVYADFFGATDILHVGLVLWGISDDRPPASLDATTVIYTDKEFSVPVSEPKLNATKYLVLPGISIFSVSVQTPPGAIVDNNAIKTSGDNALTPLGSLAPLQTAKTRTLRMGGSAFSQETVEYGISDGAALTVSATTESSLSFLIIFIELAVLLLVLFVVGYIRYRRGKLNRHKSSREAVQMHQEAEGGDIEFDNLVTTPPPDEHPDQLPETMDPGTQNINQEPPRESSIPPPQDKSDTIEPKSEKKKRPPKPPHGNLIQ